MLKYKKRRIRGKQQKPRGYSSSFGLACLRYNKENEIEILLVKKRCTYMYASFLNGLYKKKDISYINIMFNGMTRYEKADILTLNFEIMWIRMYVNIPQKTKDINFDIKISAKSTTNTYDYIKTYNSYYDSYMKKKRKFELLFLYDGGIYIKNFVHNSIDGIIKWEIPRGKKEKEENMLDCAIREFKEETGICVNNYNILFGIEPIVDTYVSSGIQYIHTYYMAMETGNAPHAIKNLSEIEESQWLNVNALKYMKSHIYIHSLVKSIVKKYTNYLCRQ